MEHPTDRVVDKLGLGERLMATLMRTHPETSRKEARSIPVEGPEHDLGQGVHPGTGKAEVLWGYEGIKESSCLPENGDNKEVPDPELPRQ